MQESSFLSQVLQKFLIKKKKKEEYSKGDHRTFLLSFLSGLIFCIASY